MRKPCPNVLVNTYSEKMRLKRRFEVYVEDTESWDSVVLQRFTTLEEAESYAERLRKVVAS